MGKKWIFLLCIFILPFFAPGAQAEEIAYRGFLDPVAREFFSRGDPEEVFALLLVKEEELAEKQEDFEFFAALAEIEIFRGEIKETAGLADPDAHFSRAYDLAEKALEMADTSRTNRLAAEALTRLFDYRSTFFIIRNGNRALGYLDRAVELGEDRFMVQLVRGNYLINAPRIGGGNREEGLKIFEDIIGEGHPVFSFMLLNFLAYLANEEKDEEKARSYLEQAEKIYPESPWLGKIPRANS